MGHRRLLSKAWQSISSVQGKEAAPCFNSPLAGWLAALPGLCVLDIELATQDFEDEEEAGLYPFNAARNRALKLARTEVCQPRPGGVGQGPCCELAAKGPPGRA
jgi:hypothetical protein